MADACVLCGVPVPPGASAKADLCVCAVCSEEQRQAEFRTVRAPRPFETPDEIVPGLFLGGEHSANDLDRMRALGIRAVLVAADMCAVRFPEALEYLVLPVDDSPLEKLRPHFERAHAFIDAALGGTAYAPRARGPGAGGCLVHCVSGISRSATIVASYLMRTRRLDFETALALVRARRAVASPNSGFAAQLREYEAELAAASESCATSSPR